MIEEKQVLARYAELKKLIKSLEEESEGLKGTVMTIIESKGADEVQTEFGTFIRASRRTYTYPVDIVALDGVIKEKKKEAEATGSATYIEKAYILFKDIVK